MFAVIIAAVVRGYSEAPKTFLDSNIFDGYPLHPEHDPYENRHAVCYAKFVKDELKAFEIANKLNKLDDLGIVFDYKNYECYMKSGHILIHDMASNNTIWNSHDYNDISYMFDGKYCSNLYITELFGGLNEARDF